MCTLGEEFQQLVSAMGSTMVDNNGLLRGMRGEETIEDSQDGGTTEDWVGAPPPGTGAVTAAAANPLPGHAGGAAVPPPATTIGQEVFTPRRWMATELQQDDLLIQALIPADHKLLEAYVDTIHQNDHGTHLDGGIGIGDDRLWQQLGFTDSHQKGPWWTVLAE